MNLSDIEIDKLKELANIMAGNADTAFSKILKRKVDMSVPKSFLGTIDQLQDEIANTQDLITAICVGLSGELNGAMLFTLDLDNSMKLSKLLGDKIKTAIDLRELDKSAIVESVNILAATSAKVMVDMLKLEIKHSVPELISDMQGAILNSVILCIDNESSQKLVVRVNLYIEDEEISGSMYYIFDKNSIEKILERLNKFYA